MTIPDQFATDFQNAQTPEQKIIIIKKIASYFSLKSNHHEALKFYELALKLSIDHSLKTQEADFLRHIGYIYTSFGKYEIALEYLTKCLKLKTELRLTKDGIVILNNIASIFFRIKSFQKSSEIYKETLVKSQIENDQFSESIALGGLGSIAYEADKDCKTALEYLNKSLFLKIIIEDHIGQAIMLKNMANIYLELKMFSTAQKYLEKSITKYEELDNLDGIASVSIFIGNLYNDDRFADYNLDTSITYYHKGLDYVLKTGHKEYQYIAHENLSEVHKKKKDFKMAFAHFKEFHRLKKEVFNEDSDKKIRNLQVQSETEKEKKNAEINRIRSEEISELNSFKTRLLAVVSHDLKNPLSGILMASEHALARPDFAVQALGIIDNSARKMLHFIDDLLSSETSESGTFTTRKEKVDLYALLEQTLEPFYYKATSKHQNLLWNCAGEVWVAADKLQLTQVFENLISNALKFTGENKQIEISIIQISDTDRVHVCIREDMKKLFGEYQPLSAKPTHGESSTGVGLSIVKQFVVANGGKVWAESEGKDKGTTFIIELPLFQGM
jgi:tetratricopeptide (TPR) repeat protein